MCDQPMEAPAITETQAAQQRESKKFPQIVHIASGRQPYGQNRPVGKSGDDRSYCPLGTISDEVCWYMR